MAEEDKCTAATKLALAFVDRLLSRCIAYPLLLVDPAQGERVDVDLSSIHKLFLNLCLLLPLGLSIS